MAQLDDHDFYDARNNTIIGILRDQFPSYGATVLSQISTCMYLKFKVNNDLPDFNGFVTEVKSHHDVKIRIETDSNPYILVVEFKVGGSMIKA